MKVNITYALFFLCLGAWIFMGNSGGAGAVQGADRTGSPIGTGSCSSCHNSGSFNPTLDVSLLENDEPITEIMGGQTYQLKVVVNAGSGTPAGYGFQAVALMGSDNANAGAFGTPPSGVQVTDLNSRSYAEQSMTSTSNEFIIDWTAPADPMDSVRFYVAGNAVNGVAGSGGDNGVILLEPLTLAPLIETSVEDNQLADHLLRVFPNPVTDYLTIDFQVPVSGQYQLRLQNMLGQTIYQESARLNEGQYLQNWEMSDQPAGAYLLSVSNNTEVITHKVLK